MPNLPCAPLRTAPRILCCVMYCLCPRPVLPVLPTPTNCTARTACTASQARPLEQYPEEEDDLAGYLRDTGVLGALGVPDRLPRHKDEVHRALAPRLPCGYYQVRLAAAAATLTFVYVCTCVAPCVRYGRALCVAALLAVVR